MMSDDIWCLCQSHDLQSLLRKESVLLGLSNKKVWLGYVTCDLCSEHYITELRENDRQWFNLWFHTRHELLWVQLHCLLTHQPSQVPPFVEILALYSAPTENIVFSVAFTATKINKKSLARMALALTKCMNSVTDNYRKNTDTTKRLSNDIEWLKQLNLVFRGYFLVVRVCVCVCV